MVDIKQGDVVLNIESITTQLLDIPRYTRLVVNGVEAKTGRYSIVRDGCVKFFTGGLLVSVWLPISMNRRYVLNVSDSEIILPCKEGVR